jgi:phosphopantothenoylcysteine decarboxylase/phosphopantothenate--cysteine ligase
VDAIVLNDVARSDIGFDADRNEVNIVTARDAIAVPEASKLDVAQKILEAAVRLRQQHATLVPTPVRS